MDKKKSKKNVKKMPKILQKYYNFRAKMRFIGKKIIGTNDKNFIEKNDIIRVYIDDDLCEFYKPS